MISNWFATFKDLREAGITLDEWLAFHKARRSELSPEEFYENLNVRD